VLDDLKKKEKKLHLVSAHDTTILPLLVTLNIFDGEWPDFCAEVAIELWEEKNPEDAENRFSVRILYNGKEQRRLRLEDFEKFCENRIPSSYEEECQLGAAEFNMKGPVGGSNF